ncbi:FGGY family carbohydrate kinase, partial [Salinispira pacifica]
MPKYVAAIDQGTTSTRFIVFDHGGKIIAVNQLEHEQIFPKPGWVEHNPLSVWERTQEVVHTVLSKGFFTAEDIAA